VVIWLHFSRFGMLSQEKSGNPGVRRETDEEKVLLQLF
jgi:hypothetical protein